MRIETPAIVCAVRGHGEHGAIVRAMTPDDGLVAGYVRGGRSRAHRPLLIAGNAVQVSAAARTEQQLAAMTVELVHSRAPMLAEPLAAAAIDWSCALTAAALPEAQPYPRLYAALAAVLDAIEAAPAARGWAVALARYELLLLAELGFGLDLESCAATGATTDLVWVSPRSGRAVSGAAGQPHAARLFALPRFLGEGGDADWPDIVAALRLTRHFLARDLLTGRAAEVLAARDRLVTRIERAIA